MIHRRDETPSVDVRERTRASARTLQAAHRLLRGSLEKKGALLLVAVPPERREDAWSIAKHLVGAGRFDGHVIVTSDARLHRAMERYVFDTIIVESGLHDGLMEKYPAHLIKVEPQEGVEEIVKRVEAQAR